MGDTSTFRILEQNHECDHSNPWPINEARRFTLDGSEELEQRLALACKHVLEGIRAIVPADKLEALLLGGGYGRGEGGRAQNTRGRLNAFKQE